LSYGIAIGVATGDAMGMGVAAADIAGIGVAAGDIAGDIEGNIPGTAITSTP
jgi:hypothetical protein